MVICIHLSVFWLLFYVQTWNDKVINRRCYCVLMFVIVCFFVTNLALNVEYIPTVLVTSNRTIAAPFLH